MRENKTWKYDFSANQIEIPELRANFKYDPLTGKVYRTNPDTGKVNEVGFSDSKGYVSIVFNCRQHKAHRMAWALHYGEHPKLEVDHINRVKTDNRIDNLRLVSRTENNKNRKFKKTESKRKREIFNMLLSGKDPHTIPDLSCYFPYSFKY
jgi:hypothetical protein